MSALAWMACLIVAPWLVIGGVVALMLGYGVLEVLTLMVAALDLLILGGLLLINDYAGPRR